MRTSLPNQLKRLDDIARSLTETKSLKEVKAIRDKAEAARHYAQAAALGLKVQNRAAELKLRAERRAGQLLSEIAPHGGNRKSRCHDGNLKLSDLGINAQQSARWRRESAIPDDLFETYVAESTKAGRDITAQGLLRLERVLSKVRTTIDEKRRSDPTNDNGRRRRPESECSRGSKHPVQDAIEELKHHRNLMAQILTPIVSDQGTQLKLSERRLVERLLREIEELIVTIEEEWKLQRRVYDR